VSGGLGWDGLGQALSPPFIQKNSIPYCSEEGGEICCHLINLLT
jgi:hypothetical protein